MANNISDKTKLTAGLLGLFLGSFGVHKFYLGDSKAGIIRIVVTVVTCGIGGLWGVFHRTETSRAFRIRESWWLEVLGAVHGVGLDGLDFRGGERRGVERGDV